MGQRELLEATVAHALAFLDDLPERRVSPSAGLEELRTSLGGPLPAGPSDPAGVIDALVHSAGPGLLATPSARFFGFVIGGCLPASIAADWLTTIWDQNHGLYATSPAASVIEEVAGGWLKDLLGLPGDASVGYVTGGQMANFTALAAARHHVLARAGWDLNSDGLGGAPRVRVLAGDEYHVTISRALRLLGIGTNAIETVRSDGQGRVRPDLLATALRKETGPTIVCAQAGNVNTGAIDPIGAICDLAHDRGAWVHIDGAFGLWAAAVPRLSPLLEGVERADSWATDAHKWLNVPYDSGLAFCAHAEAHRAAMSVHASYLVQSESDERDPVDWTPEFSRRARGFCVYAALKSLGRSGVVEMVERCCAHARRFAERLLAQPGVEILNEVKLNQVLVRFGDDDDLTRRVIALVQSDGTCWLGGSVWQDKAVMRISVSNWSTTTEDVDRSIAAILRCAASAQV
jgi:glutamate/tyrosine decarboxylase-like PLP-dependent enzyme